MELNESGKTTEELVKEYNSLPLEQRKMLDASYDTVKDTHGIADRLTEIKEFCRRMGYKRIGVAFCKGLRVYGQMLDAELSKDFDVVSVCCNVHGVKRADIGVAKMTDDDSELACNPLGEAAALNNAGVDMVIKCGFCLGHDILFSSKIEAPCTTFIVKDRKYKHKTADVLKD